MIKRNWSGKKVVFGTVASPYTKVWGITVTAWAIVLYFGHWEFIFPLPKFRE
jgi:hypothetical protein